MGKSDLDLFISKLGARIKELRLEQGLTQLNLAIKSSLGESNTTTRRWETTPTLKILYRVVQRFEIEISLIFSFSL